jgi:perosamine synthetase
MIPYGKHFIDDKDIEAVVAVLKGENLTQGTKVEEFERAVANYVGCNYAVAVSSGTAALHLAAIAGDVGVGDSVITTPVTFVATANAILYVGASPLFADIDPSTINISSDSIKNILKTENNIKAIIPVHFSGLPCAMDKIKKYADDASVIVIEDAAHALGSSYRDGTKVGSCKYSLMTIFSFHPVKAIAAGEGGMITTNDEKTYHRLLRLRSHGINKDTDSLIYPDQKDSEGIQAQWYYEMQELGYNYRITDIQCALGISQLNKLDQFLDRRKVLVKKYNQAFKDIESCQPAQQGNIENSGHHLYVLRIKFDKYKISRQQFIKKMKENGIGCQVHYIPVPMNPKYKQLGYEAEKYIHAMKYYQETISIPLYYSMTDEQQLKVIGTIKKILGI